MSEIDAHPLPSTPQWGYRAHAIHANNYSLTILWIGIRTLCKINILRKELERKRQHELAKKAN